MIEHLLYIVAIITSVIGIKMIVIMQYFCDQGES